MMDIINYTEEDKGYLTQMFEEILREGVPGLLITVPEIDWNLPGEVKVKMKQYRISIRIDDPPFLCPPTTPSQGYE